VRRFLLQHCKFKRGHFFKRGITSNAELIYSIEFISADILGENDLGVSNNNTMSIVNKL